jgi:hypothetical protein
MSMNMFLPKGRVFIPELDVQGVVTGVHLSIGGTEYKVRYFDGLSPQETYFYDFEVSAIPAKAQI